MQDQATLWNGQAGRAWVETQELLDRLYQPFETLLISGLGHGSGTRVLDVGCGTGAVTVAAARRVNGAAVGVDISEPMIEAARARADGAGVTAKFICSDAQSYPFEQASFDSLVSRFGVMFFEDAAQAFRNLRHAVSNTGEIRFVAWRSPSDNPFMTTAERAAASLLPNLPPRRADAPGQFGFSDAGRVRSLLEQSGWDGVDIQPIDVECRMRKDDLIQYVTRLGPVGMILQDSDERTRAEVLSTILPAFEPYLHGAEVRFTAACWMAEARAA